VSLESLPEVSIILAPLAFAKPVASAL
jgi:hypothetical protein